MSPEFFLQRRLAIPGSEVTLHQQIKGRYLWTRQYKVHSNFDAMATRSFQYKQVLLITRTQLIEPSLRAN